MKTRENELHEPKIETLWSIYSDMISVQISCSVCGEILVDTEWQSYVREQFLRDFVTSELKNYCPQCGARLKEIEE